LPNKRELVLPARVLLRKVPAQLSITPW